MLPFGDALVEFNVGQNAWNRADHLMAGANHTLPLLSTGQIDEFLNPLISRIGTLAQLAAEDEDQEAIRPESIAGFLHFLHVHRTHVRRRPQLVLTPAGHLRAEWRETGDYRIAVTFLHPDEVTFVSFAPDARHHASINRVGGSSSVGRFFETIPNAGSVWNLLAKNIRRINAPTPYRW